jgi:hypothetical protein
MATAMSDPAESSTREFFIYRDANGTPAVVDSLARVPEQARGSLRTVALPKQDNEPPRVDPALLERLLETPKEAVDAAVQGARDPTPRAGGLDAASLLLGAAAGFVVAVVAGRLFKAPRWLLTIGVVLLVASLGSGIFFGWVRQRVGLGDGETIALPTDMVEDARNAVEALERHYAEQKRRLEETE